MLNAENNFIFIIFSFFASRCDIGNAFRSHESYQTRAIIKYYGPAEIFFEFLLFRHDHRFFSKVLSSLLFFYSGTNFQYLLLAALEDNVQNHIIQIEELH